MLHKGRVNPLQFHCTRSPLDTSVCNKAIIKQKSSNKKLHLPITVAAKVITVKKIYIYIQRETLTKMKTDDHSASVFLSFLLIFESSEPAVRSCSVCSHTCKERSVNKSQGWKEMCMEMWECRRELNVAVSVRHHN